MTFETALSSALSRLDYGISVRGIYLDIQFYLSVVCRDIRMKVEQDGRVQNITIIL